ncbi:MAG: hypothetical protein KGM44_02745, partial [bacterium]|nr:hypothetical protein [bacterium]
MIGFRRLVCAFAAALALASSAPACAADPSLTSVHSAVADDGSARITLRFNGPLPDARVIQNPSGLVHVVFIGASLSSHERATIVPGGEILSAALKPF